MKKLLFSTMLILASFVTAFSQSTKSFFIELGGAYTTFQDVKYSAVSYGGTGVAFKIGILRNTSNAIWGAGFSANFGKETPNTHNATKVTTLNPKFYGRYLRKINEQLSIGGHWDILGLYFRNYKDLGNNGNYYLASSDLFAAATYQFGKFNFGLDLGILSYQKEGTGFAFSAPQNGLEDGDFDYQNEKLDNPFGFKYYQLKPIFKQLNLRTNITYQWKERLSVSYNWSARHFAEVENYPVTMGMHQIVLRYNITHKTKSGEASK